MHLLLPRPERFYLDVRTYTGLVGTSGFHRDKLMPELTFFQRNHKSGRESRGSYIQNLQRSVVG